MAAPKGYPTPSSPRAAPSTPRALSAGTSRSASPPTPFPPVRAGLRNIVAILAVDGADPHLVRLPYSPGAGPEHLVRLTCYVTSIDAYTAALADIGAAWKAIIGRALSGDGARRSRCAWSNRARWSRSRQPRWCPNDHDSFVRDRLPAPDHLPRFDLLDYPERLNAAAELLKGGAPDALAVVNERGRWTYAELDSLSGRIARLLVAEHGLVPGNRVLLRGPNGFTLFAAWLGVLKAGGVVVATMPLLRPGEIATVIERAQISHAIVDSRFIGDFREAMEPDAFRQAPRPL